jgi:catechol 2,3-dioxygenase-like lactoylglutathione lyase family enzyme
MESWIAQYCINVTDLDATVAFYESLGLTCTSRTDIQIAREAILENPSKGGKVQLAQQLNNEGAIQMGSAFWKLYVNTNDIDRLYRAALASGAESVTEPARSDRWPVTVGFVKERDGYLVEFVQRHPWLDGDATTYTWLGQYCINVTDIDASIRFWETLGLECTSQTDIGVEK